MFITPYEMIYKSVIPAIRAMIAQRLVLIHNLTQNEAARLLSVSQSAVSRYLNGRRGAMLKLETVREVSDMIDELTHILLTAGDQRRFLAYFTEVCDYTRRARVLCRLCKELQPQFSVEECHICDRVFTRLEAMPLEFWA